MRLSLPSWLRPPPQWLVRLAAGLLLGMALLGSTLPSLAPPEHLGLDKAVHVVAYATLTLVLACLRELRPLQALVLALTLSGLIELLQTGLPMRQGSWSDFLANGLGAVIGFLLHRHVIAPLFFPETPPPEPGDTSP